MLRTVSPSASPRGLPFLGPAGISKQFAIEFGFHKRKKVKASSSETKQEISLEAQVFCIGE